MEQFNKIKANDLRKDKIDETDLKKVKALARKTQLICFIVACALYPLVYLNTMFLLKYVTDIWSFKLSFSLIVFEIVALCVTCLFVNTIKLFVSYARVTPKKSQYGKVMSMRSETHSDNDGNDYKTCYVTAYFPEENAVIEDMRISSKDFSKAKKDERILVVSFDGKSVDCIIPED